MKKRLWAFVVAVLILLPAVPAAEAAAPDYLSKTVISHAEGAAEAAAKFEKSYSFGAGVTKDDFDLIMTLLYNDNPELFCLDRSYTYSYDDDKITGDRTVLSLIFKYQMTKEEYQSALSEVDLWKKAVTSLADPSFTDLEYALFFHDYICANYEYDSDLQSRTLYAFIKNKKGVCQAYTYAYAALLDYVGVETSWASSSEMNHIWNLVKIDGEWYHADLTWDDPSGNTPGIAGHKYFLLSDGAISTQSGGHYGWVSPYACESVKYDNSAFAKSESAYAYLADRWYYISGGNLYSTQSPDTEGVIFSELGMVWKVWESSSVYVGSYSGLISDGRYLYYNTPDKLVRMNPSSGETYDVYRTNGADGYIYGFKINVGADGISGAGLGLGRVLIHISQSPGKTGRYDEVRLSAEGGGIIGDADGNGRVNLNDVSLMLKYIAKWNVEIDEAAADTDGDGRVNISDVSYVLKKVAGWF